MLRKHPITCPHCQSELGFQSYSQYFFHNSAHTVHCPQCAKAMRPAQAPVPIWVVVVLALFAGTAVPKAYLYWVEDDLLHAVALGMLAGVVVVGLVCLFIYRRLQFVAA